MRISIVSGEREPAWLDRVRAFIREHHQLVGCDQDPEVVLALAPFASDDAEVWTIDHDGLWEFVTRQPTLHATLQSRGKVIARTSAKPDRIFFRRAMTRLGLRIAAMIE
ncbi:MAG TPA: hypothetical protein VJZ00_24405, partial [Thermoanaerobaculia bacterium]|nr:hypothetical protein [Thermoanaerobaculia bacterium]